MTDYNSRIAKTFLEIAEGLETGSFAAKRKIAVTGIGSEHGEENVLQGALMAAEKGVEVYFIGSIDVPENKGVVKVQAANEDECFAAMEELLANKTVDGAVAMHYPFPIGVSTVGRVVCPATGKKMFLATTTGTTSTDLTEGLVLNAINGIACAKACGNPNPSLGILNLNGARQAEIVLKELKDKSYDINFAESSRADGGAIMRGNDVLRGTPDVMLCDTLTGNVIIKMLAAFTSGGSFETVGDGYGPGIGSNYDKLVLIISRASGSPLIANALLYAAELAKGNVCAVAKAEHAAAEKAGLKAILESKKAPKASAEKEVVAPPSEIVTAQIPGIDVMDLDDAVSVLWAENIYAEAGMGCTGPIIRVSEANLEKAEELLKQKAYISE